MKFTGAIQYNSARNARNPIIFHKNLTKNTGHKNHEGPTHKLVIEYSISVIKQRTNCQSISVSQEKSQKCY